MKKLNISVTKAQLTGYTVDLNEKGEIIVRANIALLTDSGRKITDYSISTNSYSEDSKFELPIKCITPIINIAKELEKIITEHCQDSMMKLEGPKQEIAYEF